ncbi:glycosyltransferase [Labilibacter marinus]|uniref:glycosyltransferase n=1 Tax=Labilibacter marinus TaxID=1477105 RepID=UPI00094F7045|nr:glycosyltransferase [Labilibacter marinus]
MKIILTSIGTRGDMEPFLALGEILKDKGHHIICMFPEQFRNIAEESGFDFASLGKEFIEMLDSPAGQIAMGGGSFGFKKLRAYIKLISMQNAVNKKMILIQESVIEQEKPDRILHNGKVIYPVIWSRKNVGKTILISPVPYLHYVKNHAHVAFNGNYGPFLNKLTYRLANFGLVKTIMGSVKWLSSSSKVKQREIQQALFSNRAIYTISPTLFQRPNYWSNHLQVLGYHERSKTTNWEPSKALEDFLGKHQKIVFLTFGSMINTAPAEKTKVIMNVLEQNNIPAIINTASGGLIEPASYNKDLFHFVSNIPYDFIFPKMYAVIHHGGSGTTHTALKYGCSSLILPHIIDQYVWNKINYEKGSGPLGIDVSNINAKNIQAKLLDLLNNNNYKIKAQELAIEMSNEDFKESVHQTIIN